MALLLDSLSWLCLVAGVLLGVTAGIGLVRLPDLFTRMHAAGIGDTLAAGLVVLGLMLQAGLTINLVKLALIMIFILFTSPTSTHALAKAALHGGVKPLLDPGKDDPPSKT
jgi:multicomponent Na+:H+ antiporter subunit G